MNKKRLRYLFCTLVVILTFITFKILYLQTIKNDYYVKKAVNQRAIEHIIQPLRGNIYDRNMISFTNTQDKYCFILIPNYIDNDLKALRKLSLVSDFNIDNKLNSFREGNNIILFSNKNTHIGESLIEDLKGQGVKVLKLSHRYSDRSIARHIIGYVTKTDMQGKSGIEKMFNEQLDADKAISLDMIGTAKEQPISGLGYKVSNYNAYDVENVKLTLDFHVQKIVEEVMDNQIKSGAVIVSDCSSGDILACASRPNYRQDMIENYIEFEGSNLVNKVFSNYNLGSVFKIIVAASALESRVVYPDTFFNCTGIIEVAGKDFGCSHKEGHGEIDFTNAFSKSCNTAFIDAGLKTGQKSIVEMAERFGFGKKTNLLEGVNESKGNLPDKKYFSLRETANISIGQGKILATPIQVLEMINIVANNGEKVKTNIVDSIVDESGKTIKKVKNKERSRIINSDIAAIIKNMMYETTKTGTGINANLDQYGGSAGKTGTAETGWVENGEVMVHAWFVGFYPINEPQYSIVVFVENGKWGSISAAPVFKTIAERIEAIK